jgi:hypothetical protein
MRKAIAISRETGITYCGPRVLGQLALATDDPAERESAIHEGLAILQSGAVAHNHFWFYRDVMESMLEAGRWDDAENHAQALEDFTQAERLPWTDFYIARARALARFGRGARDAALAGELRRLHDEAEHIGLKSAQPSIDGAITALSADQSSR